jgi:glycosyltransferase involved in cell wall biosynthesis
MTRVALLTEIPAPFRIPLFNELSQRLELDVLFLAERDPRRLYRLHRDELRFRHRVLRGRGALVRGKWVVVNPDVARALDAARPDLVIVGGWNQPAFWRALRWARRRRVPVAAWVESTARDARSGSPVTEWAKRRFVAGCDAFIVPGPASETYLRSLGVDPARIAVAPNAVDPGIFRDRVAKLRGERDDLRAGRGLGRPTFLAVSRLSPEKGVDVLLRAFAGLDADLVVAGGGPEEEALRALAPPGARLLGHVDRDELPAWYACADAFVLPSRSDVWAMSVNEAAAAGLPLIVSDAAGSACELVEEGVNGLVVPAGDVAALRGALERVAGDPDFRQSAGARSAEIAERYTPAAWADAVEALVRRL